MHHFDKDAIWVARPDAFDFQGGSEISILGDTGLFPWIGIESSLTKQHSVGLERGFKV